MDINQKQRRARAIDKELGVRYRGMESNLGESYKQFRKRITSKKS